MAQARANLPKILQNTDALKALCKRILKLYIVRRKKDWDSYSGQAKSYAKFALSVVSLGNYGSAELDTWRIINDCDEIKKEIEGATKYSDLFNLITKLHNKAISAKAEEVPWLSKPSLRTDTYYAIIALVQEMLKQQFPQQYEAEVRDTFARLDREKSECRERFDSSLSVDESYKNIDEILTKLVLLGARAAYFDAFGQNRNLFPHFKHVSGTTYVAQNDVNAYSQIIKIQLKQETGNSGILTGYQVPNMNIPYQLQPHFPTIYLKKEHEENLESCANLALKDPSIRPDKTFYAQYAADPKIFTARNDPADATTIMADDDSPPLSVDHSDDDLGDDSELQAKISKAQELFAPNSNNQAAAASSDVEDTDELEADHETVKNIPAPPPAQLNASANNNNVAPAPQPPSPKVSALGTFGATASQQSAHDESSASQDQSLEQDAQVEVAETQVAVNDSPRSVAMAAPVSNKSKRTARHHRPGNK